jgi:hypothetical protein
VTEIGIDVIEIEMGGADRQVAERRQRAGRQQCVPW